MPPRVSPSIAHRMHACVVLDRSGYVADLTLGWYGRQGMGRAPDSRHLGTILGLSANARSCTTFAYVARTWLSHSTSHSRKSPFAKMRYAAKCWTFVELIVE
jgi:hypothetical protein